MKQLLSLLLILSFSNFAFAQTYTFGTVKSDFPEPLIGATVSVVGTEQGVVTDVDGNYRIANNGKAIEFKYLGFETLRLENPNGEHNVVLKEKPYTLHDDFFIVIDKRIRSAHNYSVLPRKIIQLQNQTNLQSILNTTPGVFMHSGALNTNRITIRGIGSRSPFSTNKIKAYLNNIPLTNGSGETTIEDVDLSFIKNIEIWKGPTASLYGAGLGGVVLMNTEIRNNEKPSISTNNTIGSFGLFRNATNLHISQPENKFSLQVNYNLTNSDGYRENNKYQREGFTLLSHVGFESGVLNIFANYTKLNAFIPSSLNEEDYLNEPTKAAFTWGSVMGFEDYDRLLAGISFDQKINKSTQIKYAVFLNNRQSYESRPFNILTENSQSIGARLVLDLFRQHYNWKLSIGTEIFKEDYNWETFVTNDGELGAPLSINEEDRSYSNFFAETQYRFNQKFKLNAGVNFNTTQYNLMDRFSPDSIDISGDYSFDPVLSPRVTFSYTPDYNLDFYILASHGFSPPTLEETLAPDGTINEDIQPERAWNFEIGSRSYRSRKKWQYEISLFSMQVNDLLVARRTALDQFIGVNAGKTIHSGLEAHLKYSIWKKRKNNLDLHLNYTFSNYKFKEFVDDDNDFSGNELTGTPPHVVNAILFFNYNKLYANINYNFVDAQPLTDANTIYSNAYSLLHTKVGYKFKIEKNWEFDVNAGVNNLLDEKYASMHQINAGSFGGSLPRYYYPGLPRNFYLALDVKYIF